MMIKTKIQGFTLLELMVTIAVAAVLAIVAVPSYRSLGDSSAIQAASNSLVATLHFARTQAVERDQSIRVCASDNQTICNSSSRGAGAWNKGWLVKLVNSKVAAIQVHNRRSNWAQINWNGPSTGVEFDPNGFSRGYAGSFSITGNNYPNKTCVILATTGRIRTVAGSKQTACTNL